MTYGEGWHNYHHAFPWDYKAAELTGFLNHSASFIKFLERIGLAYDLKTASPAMVKILTADPHFSNLNDFYFIVNGILNQLMSLPYF